MQNIKIIDVRCQKGDASFLLDDGKTSILYDTGFGFTGYDIAENVKSVLGERKLDYIFLTHSHYDHALGSASVLRRYPDAKVVAGKYAMGVFERAGAKRTMKELDAKFAEKCGVCDYEFLGDELRVDIAVEEGDKIRAGEMEFEVVALPGHTRCSIGFYCREKGIFLSNETLGVYDGEKTIVPSYLVSYQDTIKSIEKAEQLEIKYLLAPHYGILNEEQTKYFLDHMKSASEETAQQILDCLKSGKAEEEILRMIKEKFWHGYIQEIYPEDAVNLNTSIMIQLIKKEIFLKNA